MGKGETPSIEWIHPLKRNEDIAQKCAIFADFFLISAEGAQPLPQAPLSILLPPYSKLLDPPLLKITL